MPILNSEETAALEELRLRMKNELSPEMFNDEAMLCRFLKARDYTVDLAEVMLRKHLAWRKIHQVDTYLADYKLPEVLEKYFSSNHIGFDKHDSAITYASLGTNHYEGIFKSIKDTDLYKYYIYTMEKTTLATRKHNEMIGKEVYQGTFIFDLREVTFAKVTNKQNLRNLLAYILLANAHYPEYLKVLYIINAPFFVDFAYSFVKPFLPEVVQKKIHFFGTDGWKEVLLNLIDADVLPAFLGGKRTDPDGNPFCRTEIIHGDIVPEKYYMCNTRKPMYKRADSKELLIPALSNKQVKINVAEYDLALEWEYETKSGDIGFGLFYQENCNDVSDIEELIPVEKVHSCDGSERGMFKCLKPGTYILQFDNTYSYFYQKDVYYKVITRKLMDTGNSALE